MVKTNNTIKIKNMTEVIKDGRLVAKTGDNNGRDLVIQLVDDNDKPLNTDGARVTLAYKTPNGVVNEIPFVNGDNDTYKLTYDTILTHVAGNVEATVRLKTFDSTTETPNFEIYVEESPLNGIHFSEIDGLTFKKVMDRIDSFDIRTRLIEEDIMLLDEQLQEVNTKLVFVEEEDGLEERVYNTENDIILLTQEIERIDGELAEIRDEIANIEVGTGSGDNNGGGNNGNVQDTGWRVVFNVNNFGSTIKVYVRRVKNEVKLYGTISRSDTMTISGNIFYSLDVSRGRFGFPTMFWTPTNSGDFGIRVEGNNISESGQVTYQDSSYVVFSKTHPEMLYRLVDITYGYFSGSYFTDRPFTDDYMDLPLADFN